MATTPTVILVHGAFADASGYRDVIRTLQAAGVSVRAPMNPLRGLASDAEALTRYTTAIDGPIVLVGHSYGGAVISQAAPSVKGVTGLVFLSAFGLDEGESCASVQAPFPAPLLASTSIASPYEAPGAAGGPDLFIRIADFHQTFCADLPEVLSGAMAVSQRPLSLAALTESATAAGWKFVPSWFLASNQDNAIHPDAQRFMAKRMNATTEVVDGSHAAFIAHPDIASALILKAVAAASQPDLTIRGVASA